MNTRKKKYTEDIINKNLCAQCQTTDSVQWRNSTFGDRLCNKCGVKSLRLNLSKKRESINSGIERHTPRQRQRPRKQSAPKRANFE
jgi:Zn ribbon nucleic-acid-binding protein